MFRHEWGPLLRSIASIDRSASDHAADAAPLFPDMARQTGAVTATICHIPTIPLCC